MKDNEAVDLQRKSRDIMMKMGALLYELGKIEEEIYPQKNQKAMNACEEIREIVEVVCSKALKINPLFPKILL